MANRYIPPPPSAYGGTVSPQGGSIAQLILAQGQQQADQANRSGEIWGNAIASATDVLGGALQQRGQQQQLKKRDAAWINYVQSGDWRDNPENALVFATKVWGPQDGPKQAAALQSAAKIGTGNPEEDRKNLGVVIQAADKLDDTGRAHLWPQLATLGKKVFPQAQIGDQYDPVTWKEISAIGQSLTGAKAPELKTATVPGPDGLPMLKSVTPEELAAGVPTYVAPKEGKKYEVEVPGPNGTKVKKLVTEDQLTAGVQQYVPPKEPKGGEDDAKRKQLVAAVVSNPALYDRLTPTEVGQIAGDLHAQGFDFGKALPEKAIGKISESKSAMDSLKDLRDVLKANEQYIGPIAGFQAMNPYSDARKAQANIDLVRQRVGKALEGGVLRKEDEEKYKKILATLRDEPETAIYKVDNIIKNLENDLGNYINEQKLAGRRVSTGTDNRAGGMAPTKGKRKIVNGKLAEWDGKGWMAVQ